MRFVATTPEGATLTWEDGELTGDEYLVTWIQSVVDEGFGVSYNYWGEREASLATAFDAYITIGYVLEDVEFDPIPDSPDGYEPEGPRFDNEAVVAAALSRLR